MNIMTKFTVISICLGAVSLSCAKAKFKNAPAKQDQSAPLIEDPKVDPKNDDATGPTAGGDDQGIGYDPDPKSTLPPTAYPPGSKKPDKVKITDDNVPDSPNSPEDAFVKCVTGADKDQFPVFAKAYEFGVQNAYAPSVIDVLASLYYGFNSDLPKPQENITKISDAILPFELVREALRDLRAFTTKQSPTMNFLFNNFKTAQIEENASQSHKNKFNYRTRFCMRNFDVAKREWTGGFPETNDHGAAELKEWFSIRASSYFFVPDDGKYEFMLRSDDGSLFQILEKAGNGIGEIFALSHDGIHSDVKGATAAVELKKNSIYVMHMRHFQGPRDYIALQLFWKKPGDTEWEIVPTSAFRYDDKLLDAGGHRPY